MKITFVISFFSTLIFSLPLFAFPDLTRHGYANCMTCHISPTGGGVLSEYGRALSKELLSTWGREGEESFFWLVPTTERLALGGDFRSIQMNDKMANGTTQERWVQMQRDLEAALTVGKWTTAATIGLHDPDRNGKDRILSRRHYVMHRTTDEISLRAGRFYPAFGLHLPEHNTVIRRGLGWDQGFESYNLEGAYQGEKWHYFGTLILGRPDATELVRDKGFSLVTAYHPGPKTKIGLSYSYGESSDLIRHQLGPHWVWGIGEHFYWMGQVTGVRAFPYTADEHQWGVVDYMRFNYEFYKGMHGFLAQEFSQTNLNSGASRTDIHTLGFQFFPRPHFELQILAQKFYAQGIGTPAMDRMSVLLHFYP